MTQPTARYAGLEAARGVAALLVVLHHASSIAAEPRFIGAQSFGGLPAYFYVGVDFFFVLSGFIIAHSHMDDIGRPAALPRYAARRFLRIFPPYWGVLVPLTLAYLIVPGAGKADIEDPATLAASFLLLPSPHPLILGVAWTLVHEVIFYAVFGVIVAGGRRLLWVLPVWAAAIVAWHLAGGTHFLGKYLLSPFNIEFIMGVGAAFWCRGRTPPAPLALAIGGALLFTAAMVAAPALHDERLLARLVFGAATVLFIIGCVGIERRRTVAMPAALWAFGASSYAVYLVHAPAMALAAHALVRLPFDRPGAELAAFMLALFGFGAGVMYWLIVEKPATRPFAILLAPFLRRPEGAR